MKCMHVCRGVTGDRVGEGSRSGGRGVSVARTHALTPREMRNYWGGVGGFTGAETAPAHSGHCPIRTCGCEGSSMESSHETQWSEGRGKVASPRLVVEIQRSGQILGTF